MAPLPVISSQQAESGVRTSIYNKEESGFDVEPHAQIHSGSHARGVLAVEVLHS